MNSSYRYIAQSTLVDIWSPDVIVVGQPYSVTRPLSLGPGILDALDAYPGGGGRGFWVDGKGGIRIIPLQMLGPLTVNSHH